MSEMFLWVETDGKHTHCLPITFTVNGDRLPIPLCCSLRKRKCFEDTTFVWYFGLL